MKQDIIHALVIALNQSIIISIQGCLLWLVTMREVSSDDRCTPEHMTQCTDPLTMLTDNNDLSWASSKSELNRMCPKLMDGIACINSFTVR